MKFKLREKVGTHREGASVYTAGQVLESVHNLAQLFPDKFDEVDDNTPVDEPAQTPGKTVVPSTNADDEDVDTTDEDVEVELSEMSVAELKAVAKEEGIDVKGLRKKNELIAAIEAGADASDEDDDVEEEDEEEDDDEE